MASIEYHFELVAIKNSCQFLVENAMTNPKLFSYTELQELRREIESLVTERNLSKQRVCEKLPSTSSTTTATPGPRSRVKSVLTSSKFTEEEDERYRKALEEIEAGDYTAMEYAKSISEEVDRPFMSVYNRMRRLKFLDSATSCIVTKEDQQIDRSHRKRMYRTAGREDGTSDSDTSSTKRVHSDAIQRQCYSDSENALILRTAHSILQGTATLKEVTQPLASQMSRTYSAIRTKLNKLMKKLAVETASRRRPRGKYTPPLAQRLGVPTTTATVSPLSACGVAAGESDADTVSGSVLDMELRSDTGSASSSSSNPRQALSIEELADILVPGSSDHLLEDWL